MKLLYQTENKEYGQNLSHYLITQGIMNQLDHDDSEYEIWVHEEDLLKKALQIRDEFKENPNNPKYQNAQRESLKILHKQAQQEKAYRENVINVRTQYSAGSPQKLTQILIALCVILFVLDNVGSEQHLKFLWMLYYDYPQYVIPFQAISEGQIWRLVTPIFMHGNFMHILFNMIWLHSLGGMIESKKGIKVYFFIVISVAIISNTSQYIVSGPLFLGMSGVNYGLFGYIWMKMKFQPHEGLRVDSTTIFILMAWFGLCYTGLFGNVANTAHAGGLIAGIILGSIPGLIQQQRKQK